MRRKLLILTLLMAVCVTLAIPLATYAQSPQPPSPAFTAAAVDTICADVNYDGSVNVADAIYLIGAVFKCWEAPQPYCIADVNGDGAVNIADPVYLISYIFRGGPPPEPCCTEAVDQTTVQRLVKCGG
jgi:hypothetical protein